MIFYAQSFLCCAIWAELFALNKEKYKKLYLCCLYCNIQILYCLVKYLYIAAQFPANCYIWHFLDAIGDSISRFEESEWS